MTIITVNVRAFNAAIKAASAIVERSGIPIMNNVRLSVERGILTIIATDMEMWVTQTVPCEADTITATTLSASMLSGIFGSLEAERATIEVNGADAVVKAGRSRFKLKTIPAEAFPLPTLKVKDGDRLVIPTAQLADAINTVTYASADNITHTHLKGVHFQTRGDRVELASFDTKRLAFQAAANVGDDIEPFTLPAKSARALAVLCGEDGDDIEIRTDDRCAHICHGNWTLLSKLVEGKFPDYAKLLGEPEGDVIIFKPDEMRRALGRLALVADKSGNGVRVTISEGSIQMALASAGLGDATEEIPVFYEGAPVEIGYNLHFLRDAIRRVTSEEAEFFIDNENRALVRPVGDVRALHSFGHYSI